MATNMSVRIALKYDSLTNWTTNNPVLLQGEMAIVNIPAEAGSGLQEPAIIAKIGNGTDKFNDLPWFSGIAADVYEWAKAEAKPTYTAQEISGLDEYIAGEIQDTDTQYQLVKLSGTSFKLQSKALGSADWSDVTTIDLTTDVNALITTAIEALDVADTAVDHQWIKQVSQTDGKINVVRSQPVIGDVSGLETALAGKQATVAFDSEYNSDTNKAATVATVTNAVNTAKTELIGTSSDLSSANTINAAKKYADEKIASQIAAVYKPAGSTAFADLPTPAVGILGNVYNVTDAFEADTKFVTGEQGNEYPAGTNVAVIEVEGNYYYDVMAGFVDLSSYSTTEQMNSAIDADVAAAKTELIGIGDATSTTIKAAVAEAKTYADGLNTAMDSRVDALETAIGEGGSVETAITDAIAALDVTDTTVEHQFVVSVNETDGKVVIARAQPEIDDVNGLEAALNAKATQTDLDALEALVGDTAVSTQISTEIAKLVTDDTAIANQFVTEVDLGTDGLTVKRASLTEAAIPPISSAKISDFNTAADARVTAGITAALEEDGVIDTAIDNAITGKVNYTDELILNCGSSNTNIFTA